MYLTIFSTWHESLAILPSDTVKLLKKNFYSKMNMNMNTIWQHTFFERGGEIDINVWLVIDYVNALIKQVFPWCTSLI